MASLDEITSFEGPTVYANEAPDHSQTIGQVLSGVFNLANSVIQKKYGVNATVPGQGGTTARTATTLPGASSGFWLVVVFILILVLATRR